MAYHLGNPIRIADYDPQWPKLYATEQHCLLAVLAPIGLQFDHIGSTAVPGLAAKPIIDISIAVRERSELTPYLDALRGLGYEEIPILPRFQRRLLAKGPYNEGSHHVHVTDYGSDTWAEPIVLRDYLRAHAEVAAHYAEVKRAAAARHGTDLNGYHDEKAPFVTAMLADAKAWHVGQRSGLWL